MDNQAKEITTPNGYKATIKGFLTFGEFNRIQTAVTSGINFNLKEQNADSISGDILLAAQKVSLQICLLKLIDPSGNELSTPEEAIDDIPMADGQMIMDAINEVTNEARLNKKKES